MVEHRIPLERVRARLLYRTGETVMQWAHKQAAAQEVRAVAISDPTNLVTRTWVAGGAFVRGVMGGGACAALSEPYYA